MKCRKQILLIMSLMLILFMFGCGDKEKEVESMPEMDVPEVTEDENQEAQEVPANIDIKTVFPTAEGFMWRYEGPVESGKTVLLHKVEDTDEGMLLHVMAIMDDASGEKPLEDRIVKSVYIVTDDRILENGRELLKTPLEVGNQWSHQHILRDSGEVRYATTEIIEVTEDTIKTETHVDNVFGYPDETYTETNTYSVGAGCINQTFNVQGIDDFELGYFIYKTFLKPYDEEGKILHEPFDLAMYEGTEIKAYPIVAYDNYLIGGVYAGKWMNAYQLAPKIVGEETYKVFNLSGRVAEGLGTSPVKDVEPFEWYKIDIRDPFGELIIDRREEHTTYQSYFSNMLACSSDWNPRPRPVVEMKVYNEIYQNIVSDILAGIDLVDAPIDIKQILNVDLEGDGVDEVIITASSYKAPIDFLESPERYSFVVLRKIIKGEVQNIMLAGDYHKEGETEGLNYIYYVPFILDLNGDGRMEIVTEGMYYEGQWLDIIDVDGDTIQSVLSDGPQI